MYACYMNGAGNDFMVIDARNLTLELSKLALELCKLTGADGFMALDHSEIADFRLHFYNSNGARGEMCGNGARCICRFAYEKGLAGEAMRVETDAGIVYGWRLSESQYRVKLNNPSVIDLRRSGEASYVELGDPGIPHAVLEIPGLKWEDREALREQAKALRYAPAFPKGANVNLYTRIGTGSIRILTYERWVEDYTLACGTGSASAAVVLWCNGMVPDGKLTVENPGGTLTVAISGQDGQVRELYLEGPTQLVREYEI